MLSLYNTVLLRPGFGGVLSLLGEEEEAESWRPEVCESGASASSHHYGIAVVKLGTATQGTIKIRLCSSKVPRSLFTRGAQVLFIKYIRCSFGPVIIPGVPLITQFKLPGGTPDNYGTSQIQLLNANAMLCTLARVSHAP